MSSISKRIFFIGISFAMIWVIFASAGIWNMHLASATAIILIPILTLILAVADFVLNPPDKEKICVWLFLCAGLAWFELGLLSGKLLQLKPLVENLKHWNFIFWFLALFGVIWRINIGFSSQSCQKKWTAQAFVRFIDSNATEIAVLIVTILSLSMLFDSGYYWDDAVNSTTYLYEKYDDIPTLENALTFMRKYLELGRINVLSVYYYFWFYIENHIIYKALIILSVLISQLVLRLTVQEISRSRKAAILSMLLIPALIQIRPYQDPVSGFYGLVQIVLIEMLLTAFFLVRYLRNGKKKDLCLSMLPFFIGLMTYEVCFPFIAMIALLAWVESGSLKKAIRTTLPYCVIVFVLLAAIFVVRMLYTQDSTYVGVAFSLDIPQIIRTYFYQVTAALPLSFYTAGKELAATVNVYLADEVLPYSFAAFVQGIQITDVLMLLLSVFLLLCLTKTTQDAPAHHNWRSLAALGGCLWLLPAITISISQRYQGQLYAGLGYLPVYMEYFGVSLLICCLVISFAERAGTNLRRAIICATATLFSIVLMINVQDHRVVTEIMNEVFLYPREAGEYAIDHGLLNSIPQDAELLSVNSEVYLWEQNWNMSGLFKEYYFIHSGRKLDALGVYNLRDQIESGARQAEIIERKEHFVTLEPQNMYMIAYDGDARGGFAKLGRIHSMTLDLWTAQVMNTSADEVTYFISGPAAENATIEWQGKDRIVQESAQNMKTLSSSAKGILQSLDGNELILFESLGNCEP